MILFTSIMLLASAAIATPILQQRQMDIPSDWTWQVTGWEGGCSRGGCSYNFNVTVPTIPNQIAGVKAYCNGREDGIVDAEPNSFQACRILEGVNNGVAAKFGQRDAADLSVSPKTIEISFVLAGWEYADPPRSVLNAQIDERRN